MWFLGLIFVVFVVIPIESLLNPGQTDYMDLQHNFTTFQKQIEAKVLDLQRNANRTISDLEQKLTLALDAIAKQQNTATKQEQRLNQTTADQQQKIGQLEELVSKQNQTIVKQQHTIDTLSQQVNKRLSAYQVVLHDVVDRHNQQVDMYKNQTRILDKGIADLGKQVHDLSMSVLDAEKKTTLLNTTLQESLVNVAFTVSLSVTGRAWVNKKVVYDKVLTNVGKGYSAQTGVFTCPRDGVYVFTWNTMSGADYDDCFAYIYKNGVKSLMTHSAEAGGSANEVASNTAVFQLAKGDIVYIQTENCLYFIGYPKTAFSGWRL